MSATANQLRELLAKSREQERRLRVDNGELRYRNAALEERLAHFQAASEEQDREQRAAAGDTSERWTPRPDAGPTPRLQHDTPEPRPRAMWRA